MKRILCRTIEETKQLLSSLNTTVFSFDTETTSLRFDELEILGISFCDGETAGYIYLVEEHRTQFMELITQFFHHLSKPTIIAHNIVFDAKVLHKYGIKLKGEWFDTMVANHLIDETRENGLKYLTRELLGKSVTEFKQVSNNTDSDEFGEYGIDDAVNTWELAQRFKLQLKDLEMMYLFRKIEMPFQRVLLEMEITGVLVDKKKLEKFEEILKEDIITLESQLYDILGEKYHLQMDLFQNITGVAGDRNFNSNQQLADILFNKLGLEVVEETPTGMPKTGKITIAKYKEVPFVSALDKFKKATKLLNGFVSKDGQIATNIQSDGKLRPNFVDVGTRTGRLACRKPNLQQLPKAKDDDKVNVRECFIVPNGYKMITSDYSGQELRVLAHICNEPNMIKAFKEGKDFHQATADQFGVSRTQAKAINFGIAYRKGAYGFSKDWNCPEEEAQAVLDKYFKEFPAIKKKMDITDMFLQENGYVKTMAGRRRHFEKIEDTYYKNSAFREAFNFLVQGFSADMIRAAMVNVYALAKKHPEWDLKTIGTVHDEALYQVKGEYLEEAVKLINDAFESAVQLAVPTPSDTQWGNNYAEAK